MRWPSWVVLHGCVPWSWVSWNLVGELVILAVLIVLGCKRTSLAISMRCKWLGRHLSLSLVVLGRLPKWMPPGLGWCPRYWLPQLFLLLVFFVVLLVSYLLAAGSFFVCLASASFLSFGSFLCSCVAGQLCPSFKELYYRFLLEYDFLSFKTKKTHKNLRALSCETRLNQIGNIPTFFLVKINNLINIL